jgi:hypothetical protein
MKNDEKDGTYSMNREMYMQYFDWKPHENIAKN